MAFTIATFNVKDLFDAASDAEAPRLTRQLDTLAGTLAGVRADVIALQEVGSEAVVRALVDRLEGGPYGDVVLGTADARGIRCALVARAPLLHAEVKTAAHLAFPAFAVGDPPPFDARIPLRRGVVHARVDAGALGAIDVLVAHFKSNRPVPLRDASGATIPPSTSREYAEGNLRSLVWRAAEALFVRRLVDDLLASDPGRNVVVAGDLNDHPASTVVRIVQGGGPSALVDCALAVPEAKRFSTLRHGKGEQIDHLLATPALAARIASASFRNDDLREHAAFTEPSPAWTERGDSDHAPLVVAFEASAV